MKTHIISFALAAFLVITAIPGVAAIPPTSVPETGNTFSYSYDPGVSPAAVIPMPWGDLEHLYGTISNSNDIDYLVFSMLPGDECTWFVAFTLWITGSGDLDIEVSDLNGYVLDGSYGTDNEELLFLDAEDHGALPQTLVLKIYGYNGATGSYTLRSRCAK